MSLQREKKRLGQLRIVENQRKGGDRLTPYCIVGGKEGKTSFESFWLAGRNFERYPVVP